MPAQRLAGALFVVLLIAPAAAHARDLAGLGSLEREATEDALTDRGLQIERAPEGKRIGVIHVVNHEVFSRRDGYTQLLNIFHRTTREQIIRREVLLQPGDVYTEALAEETTRNLSDADLSSLVVIVPVTTAVPGTVDLLVVTRDVWSLRFNTDFDWGEGRFRFLDTSISENNLFGWRKTVNLGFSLRRGNYWLGPTYTDRNVAGTRLVFSASARVIFNRETDQREGETAGVTLRYPLFSLASRWGATLSASHSNAVVRSYFGNDLRRLDLRATPQNDALPYIYRVKSQSIDSQIVRSFPGAVTHRIAAGHDLSIVRPSFLPDFPSDDPFVRDTVRGAIFPRSERVSALYLSYRLFTPRYRIYRDFYTFDLREDITLGPNLSASVSRATSWLGSDISYIGLSSSASWTFDWMNGYQSAAVSWGGRVVGKGRLVDETRGISATLATPMWRRLIRVIGHAGTSMLLKNTRPNVYYTVGAESGLRAYATGEFSGQAVDFSRQASWIGHLEARSAPIAVAAFRLGAVAFYDAGHAAARFAELGAKQDVGLGLRLLIPQLNFYVLRLDWAVALQNGTRTASGAYLTKAGLPGRITFAFRQAF